MIVVRRSLAEVMAALGLDAEALYEAEAAVVAEHDAPAWYIRALSGVAAWLSSLSLLGCLGLAGLVESESVALVLGLLLCGGATTLRHAGQRVGGTFVPQMALACSLAGQCLAIVSMFTLTESTTTSLVFGALLEVALVAAYPDALHRFLSTVSAGVMMGGGMHELAPVPLHLVGAPLLAAACALWHWEARLEASPAAALRTPVAYGCVVCTFAVLLFGLLGPDTQQPLAALTTLGMTAVTAGLSLMVLHERGVEHLPYQVGIVVVLLLLSGLTFSTPGIIAALGTMVLAFHRRSPQLLGMGAVFLTGFLTFFYYELTLSLWIKSGVLIGSGGLMLAARLLLPVPQETP